MPESQRATSPRASSPRATSPREAELVEAAYRYALEHGISRISLRPLSTAIGSSPGVLSFLFRSKNDLVRAILARARQDELRMLEALREESEGATLLGVARALWDWLADPAHRPLLCLWVECYGQSLVDPSGPWSGFAADTVSDWLQILRAVPVDAEGTDEQQVTAQATAVLAVLRGCLLDLLATGDRERIDRALDRLLSDALVRY